MTHSTEDSAPENLEDFSTLAQETAQGALKAGANYVRENPVPVIIGALVVGAAIGLLLAPRENKQKDTAQAARDLWETIYSDLSDKLPQLKKQYAKSSAHVADHLSDLGSKLKWW